MMLRDMDCDAERHRLFVAAMPVFAYGKYGMLPQYGGILVVDENHQISHYSNDTIPAHGVYCDAKNKRLLVLTVESKLYSLSLTNGSDATLLLNNMTYNRKFISPDPFDQHRFYLSSFGSGVLVVDEIEETVAPNEPEKSNN